MSNHIGGVDSRGSYTGQPLLYTGGGTGEPISSFPHHQMLSANNSIHNTRGNQGDSATPQGKDFAASTDLLNSKENIVDHKPTAPSS